jgi:hypothetical protein
MSQSSIRNRTAPTTTLRLEVEDANGSTLTEDLKIRIDYNVLSDAQEACGFNFVANGILEWADDPARIRALLWAALLAQHPDLDIRSDKITAKDASRAIGQYLEGSNRPEVLEALFKAYSLYLHKDKRLEFDKAANAILTVVRTGKLPEEMEAASSPLGKGESAESPSPGKSSEPSPESASESLTTTSSAA